MENFRLTRRHTKKDFICLIKKTAQNKDIILYYFRVDFPRFIYFLTQRVPFKSI